MGVGVYQSGWVVGGVGEDAWTDEWVRGRGTTPPARVHGGFSMFER